jgi:hypothetical protein
LWHEDEIAVMQHIGNAKANSQLLAKHSNGSDFRVDKGASQAEKERFVRDKYDAMAWFVPAQPQTTRKEQRSPATNTTRTSKHVYSEASTTDLLSFEADDTVTLTSNRPPRTSNDILSNFHNTTCQDNQLLCTSAPSRTQPPGSLQLPSGRNEGQNDHDAKAANVMAAFRSVPQSNQYNQAPAYWQQRQQPDGLKNRTYGSQGQIVNQVHGRNFQPPKDPFNTGFFESFGLSAHS